MCIRDRFEVNHLETASLKLSRLEQTEATVAFLNGELDALAVSYTHLRAHETPEHLVCRLLLEKKKTE